MNAKWKKHLLAGALLVITLTLAGCAVPQDVQPGDAYDSAPTEARIHTPDKLSWGPAPESLPAGARVAVLAGDPASEGPFTMRAEMPSNYTVPRHTHRETEHVTIVSGTAYLALGADGRADATELPAGSFFMIPPGQEHTFFTGDEPVVIQVHSDGPWSIDYVDGAPTSGRP